MRNERKFYIDGQWVDPLKPNDLEVINPATEKPIAVIAMGTAADIDRAVAAAKRAFATYSQTSVEERLALLERLLEIYKRRYEEMARTITAELGAPITMSTEQHADVGVGHLQGFIDALKRLKTRVAERRCREPRTDRCLRSDHALELADQPDRAQSSAGAGHGFDLRSEAVGIHAVECAAICGNGA